MRSVEGDQIRTGVSYPPATRRISSLAHYILHIIRLLDHLILTKRMAGMKSL